MVRIHRHSPKHPRTITLASSGPSNLTKINFIPGQPRILKPRICTNMRPTSHLGAEWYISRLIERESEKRVTLIIRINYCPFMITILLFSRSVL